MSELSPLAWRLRRCLLSLERPQIQLAEVWSCLLAAAPELVAADDRRQMLRQTLDELAAANWLALPHDHNAYDRRDPPLPRTVELLAASDRAQRLGTSRAEAWDPRLAWASQLELTQRQLDDLLRINRWLVEAAATAVIVPPRERSLELFGAGCEDRLHELAASELFGPQRLTWELLCCAPVPPPFVWSPVGHGSTLLVVSGHETFASMRRVLVEAPSTPVGIVVHGAGTYFASSVPFASTLDRPVDQILYYGDLDAEDLATAQHARRVSSAAGLPPVEPATALFALLLAHGMPSPARPQRAERARELVGWLDPPIREPAMQLLVGGLRVAQEWAGYELLLRARVWETIGVA
ncbi:hypothetical protein BH23ACT10_BH23ACT10_01080 [soil metagenome]